MALYVGDTKYKVMVGNQKEDFKVSLPYDAEVEWLQSSGTQYIDCGFKMKSGLVIDIVYDNIANGFIFGSRASGSSQYSGVTNEATNTYSIRSGNTVLYTSNTQPSGTVTVHMESGNTKVNGTTVSTTSYGSSFYNGNVFLFTINNNGTAYSGDYAKNKIRKFSVGGVIDLIPVRKNGVGYMYDKISGQLFGNAGTGDFIIGKDKALPYDAEVEYLESTGTQYIDLGSPILMGDTQIESSWYLLADNRFFYMARVNASSYFWGVYAARADYGNNANGQKAVSISTNTWHNIIDTSTGFWLDGNKKIDRIAINAETANNMLLFASALNGTITCGAFRCGFFKVTTNNNVVFDLIPVRKNGVGYMYDKVSGTLFGNAGSGAFTYGNDVTT